VADEPVSPDAPTGETLVVRVWLPDRPGALGAVASRIGAVGGDVVGIDILERGAGRAIDELVVLLPSTGLVGLLTDEISQVDGVDIEEIVPAEATRHDPAVDALQAAVALVEHDGDAGALAELLCVEVTRLSGASWAVVTRGPGSESVAAHGPAPSALWVQAFFAGSQSSSAVASGAAGPQDVTSVELAGSGSALVIGREKGEFRARDREQAAALAKIVDRRLVSLGWEAEAPEPTTA
jgi:hypothetical protein